MSTIAIIVAAFVILIAIVVIGIGFDMVGVAVTVADPAPFHSMASKRVKGAKSSLTLIRNAAKMSSICNDVVGDTCGIISGTSAAYIVTQLSNAGFLDYALLSLLLSGLIGSATGRTTGRRSHLHIPGSEILQSHGFILLVIFGNKFLIKI